MARGMKGEEGKHGRGPEEERTSQGWPRDHSTASGTPNDAQCCFSIRRTSSYGFAHPLFSSFFSRGLNR